MCPVSTKPSLMTVFRLRIYATNVIYIGLITEKMSRSQRTMCPKEDIELMRYSVFPCRFLAYLLFQAMVLSTAPCTYSRFAGKQTRFLLHCACSMPVVHRYYGLWCA